MSAVRAISRLLLVLVVGMVAWSGCDRNFAGEEGVLEVTVTTLGTGFPATFRLELSGNIASNVSPNGVYRADALVPGPYTVTLTNLPANCTTGGENPRTVTIEADETAETTFTVSCLQAGLSMVFETDRDGNLDIYGANLDGSVEPLVQSLFPDFGLTVAAGNPSLLAFVRSFSGTDADIFIAQADGTGLENITQHPALDTDPTLSADGRFVVFVSDRSGDPNLFMIDRTTGELRQLTDDAFTYENPTFSPTSFSLVVAIKEANHFDLFSLDLETNAKRQLTSFAADENEPAFSPDGTLIAYTTDATGIEDIHLLALAEPDQASRLTDAKALDRAPVFSPDGSFIAFASDREDGAFDIFLMKPDGSEQVNFSVHPSFDYGPVFIGQ